LCAVVVGPRFKQWSRTKKKLRQEKTDSHKSIKGRKENNWLVVEEVGIWFNNCLEENPSQTRINNKMTLCRAVNKAMESITIKKRPLTYPTHHKRGSPKQYQMLPSLLQSFLPNFGRTDTGQPKERQPAK